MFVVWVSQTHIFLYNNTGILCVCVFLFVCLSRLRSRERDVVAPRPVHRRESIRRTVREIKALEVFPTLGVWAAVVYSRKWGETGLLAETRS